MSERVCNFLKADIRLTVSITPPKPDNYRETRNPLIIDAPDSDFARRWIGVTRAQEDAARGSPADGFLGLDVEFGHGLEIRYQIRKSTDWPG